MDRNKIKERLELALKPTKPPTLEEVLEQVSRYGVLRGAIDWIFMAWMLYVEYAAERIAKAFQLSERERSQLFGFRDAMKQLLSEAWMRTKEKLTTLYEAIAEDRYKIESRRLTSRLVAGDGVIHIYNQMYTLILKPHIVYAEFPPLLRNLRELQIGWVASDEGRNHTTPRMGTSQPWQLYAWLATRPGKTAVWINHIAIVKNGISIGVTAEARDWTEQLSRVSALAYVISEFKKGNWTPFTTAWLGDGGITWSDIRRSNYRIRLSIEQKVAEKLGLEVHKNLVLMASGRDSYLKLWSAFPDDYRRLLTHLNSHKMHYLETIVFEDRRKKFVKESNLKHVEVCGIGFRLRIRDNTLILHKYSADVAKLEAVKKHLAECGVEAKIHYTKKSLTHELVVKVDEQVVQRLNREKIIRYLETVPKERRLRLLKKYPFLSLQPYAEAL
jgi:hypothetical protein